jgi:hypothetical protein
MSLQICRSFPELCASIADTGEQPSTQGVLDRAEALLLDRFERVTQHAWDTVRSAL